MRNQLLLVYYKQNNSNKTISYNKNFQSLTINNVVYKNRCEQ